MAENHLFHRVINRRIQVDIVTIFIVLLATSSLVIMFYIYNRNYDNFLNLSGTIVQQVEEKLLEKVTDITGETQALALDTKGAIGNIKDPSTYNKDVVPFLINALKVNQLIYSINIASPEGNFLAVINLTRARLYHYYSHPSDSLPEGSKYAVRIIDYTAKVPTESWQYLNTDLKVVGTENVSPVSYDPKTDEWFTKMMTWPQLGWATAYLPRGANVDISRQEGGVTVSSPVFDSQGNVAAIIGVNVALQSLSNFISIQKIGITGQAFVLDEKENVLIPTAASMTTAKEKYAAVAKKAFEQFTNTDQQNAMVSQDRIDYLTYVSEFPLSLEEKWYVVIVVPFNDFFGAIIKTQHQTMLISLGILALFGVFVFFSSRHISRPIIQLATQVDKIRHFDFEKPKEIKSHIIEINTLDTSIGAMRAALHTFGRYIPKDIVKALIEKGQEIELGGERKEITIMFSDIQNFTTYSESLSMEKLTPFLANYFDSLSNVILEEDGTIDKYIGDSIMVFWGAPHDVADQETKGCITALRCLSVCNKNQKLHPDQNWVTRFGLHCGEAIVGNIGTTERMNYTIMGDTVNTAARLQELNKRFGTSIIISEMVQKKIGPRFVTRPLDVLAVKGKTKKIEVFELAGMTEGEFACSPEKMQLCKGFSEAFSLLLGGKTEEAKNQFLALQQKFPEDLPLKNILEKISSSFSFSS